MQAALATDCDEGDVRVVARTDSGAPSNDLAEEMSVQGGVAVGQPSRKPSMSSDAAVG
jgi:hypothetical protein